MTSRLAKVDLPDFGMPDAIPQIPGSVYQARIDRLRSRMEAFGWDRLIVYADREHSANLSYLTGFDPRARAVAAARCRGWGPSRLDVSLHRPGVRCEGR